MSRCDGRFNRALKRRLGHYASPEGRRERPDCHCALSSIQVERPPICLMLTPIDRAQTATRLQRIPRDRASSASAFGRPAREL